MPQGWLAHKQLGNDQIDPGARRYVPGVTGAVCERRSKIEPSKGAFSVG